MLYLLFVAINKLIPKTEIMKAGGRDNDPGKQIIGTLISYQVL
jgi:hypothetical protein